MQTVIKNLVSPQPAIALLSMTEGRVRSPREAISYNSISSGVTTRSAKVSGVGAVSGLFIKILTSR